MGYFLRPDEDPLKGLPAGEQLVLDDHSRERLERLNHEMAVSMSALLVTDAAGPYLPEFMKRTSAGITTQSGRYGWEIAVDAVWYMTRARLFAVSIDSKSAAVAIDQADATPDERLRLAPVCPACLGTGTPQKLGISLVKSFFSGGTKDQSERIPPQILSACVALSKQLDEMRGKGAFDPLLKRIVEVLRDARKSVFHYQMQVLTRVVMDGDVYVAVVRNIALPPIKLVFKGKTYELSSNWELHRETSIVEGVQLSFPNPCPACRGLRFNMTHKDVAFSDRLK